LVELIQSVMCFMTSEHLQTLEKEEEERGTQLEKTTIKEETEKDNNEEKTTIKEEKETNEEKVTM